MVRASMRKLHQCGNGIKYSMDLVRKRHIQNTEYCSKRKLRQWAWRHTFFDREHQQRWVCKFNSGIRKSKPNSNEFCRGTTFSKITILAQAPFTVNLPDYPNQVEFAERRDMTVRLPNSNLGASFNRYGFLKAISIDNSDNVPVHLEFLRYGARRGAERSGAYLFLPDGIATSFPQTDSSTILVSRGPLESSVAIGLPFATHETILRDGESALEIRNIVDIGEMLNTEIVMRISTGIDSKEIFYTDLNSLQYIKRRRLSKLPIQANYYPIPAGIYIEDDKLRLTILTGQPLGGSSLQPGEVILLSSW